MHPRQVRSRRTARPKTARYVKHERSALLEAVRAKLEHDEKREFLQERAIYVANLTGIPDNEG